ncbi:cyclin-U4-1 [Impatiens glandulifera]|uniref:cyclin-U4-1 n=1 Tax=Impatiens glandulifera TaxID=253017 RepID=UPI001FB103E6|nr:cyclin-U4-1 [Impatiens glandulifera]
METQPELRFMTRVSSLSSSSRLYLKLGLVDQNHQAPSGVGNPRIISIISSVLERSVRESTERDVTTPFHSSKPPGLGIRQYLERIYKYSCCSPSCLVVACVYMDRFLKQKGLRFTFLNIHRLLITSIMLAAKFLDDEQYDNAHFGKVGGVSTEEMNKLEKEFLSALNFRLHVTVSTFDEYCLWLDKEGSTASGQMEQPSPPCKQVGYFSRLSYQAKKDASHVIVGYMCKAV